MAILVSIRNKPTFLSLLRHECDRRCGTGVLFRAESRGRVGSAGKRRAILTALRRPHPRACRGLPPSIIPALCHGFLLLTKETKRFVRL